VEIDLAHCYRPPTYCDQDNKADWRVQPRHEGVNLTPWILS